MRVVNHGRRCRRLRYHRLTRPPIMHIPWKTIDDAPSPSTSTSTSTRDFETSTNRCHDSHGIIQQPHTDTDGMANQAYPQACPPVYSRHYVWDYPVPAGRPLAALPRGPWLFQGENEAWHTPAILGTIPQQQSAPTARLNQSVLLAQSSQSARPAQRNPSTRSQPIRSQPARTLTRAPTKNRLTRPTKHICRI